MSKTFCIDTPPPTVSGELHMGHIYSYTHTDFIARYKRMKGFDVVYPIGFDDNGLPTERLVEKELGVKAKDLQKEDFLNKCHSIIEKCESEFKDLFQAIDLSCDWDLKYQTISNTSTIMAQMSFLDLLEKNLIYSKLGATYWDIVDQTSLAQAELEDKEKETKMCFLKFQAEHESLEIMTTRPEMLSNCVAIFFHPNDDRYKKLEGKFAQTPFFEKKVPILSDENVKIEKGTGLVMCCKYGDWQDVEWIRKHESKMGEIPSCIISPAGSIQIPQKEVIQQFQVQDIWLEDELKEYNINKYREKIIKTLEKIQAVVKIETTFHNVKIAERSKAPIEILDSNQWYVNILDFKQDFLKITDHINFHPSHMKNKLIQWIEGLNQDWCISRDRFLGIHIPAIYKNGNIVTPNKNNLPIQNASDIDSGNVNLQVFDTWFTSSISPQLNTYYLNSDFHLNNPKKHLYPMDMRPQSHEIIRTWTFYTIVKAYFHGLTKQELEIRKQKNVNDFFANLSQKDIQNRLIPWKNVVLSGWCLASDKTKMSKSKGNGVNAIQLIQSHSSDVIRYWSSSSNLGVDTAYNETLFDIAKKLTNKLKNVANFLKMTKDNFDINISEKNIICDFDKWILMELQTNLQTANQYFENFMYAKAKETMEKFFWNDFCDNYLELIKTRSYGIKANVYAGIDFTDTEILEINSKKLSCFTATTIVAREILKFFSIFMTKSCVEIYNDLLSENKLQTDFCWTELNFEFNINHQEIHNALQILEKVRAIKSEMQISIKTPITKISMPKIHHDDIKTDLLATINALDAEIIDSDQVLISI